MAYLTRRSSLMRVDLPTFDLPISATDGPTSAYLRAPIARGSDATNVQLFPLKFFLDVIKCFCEILHGVKAAFLLSREILEGAQYVECQSSWKFSVAFVILRICDDDQKNIQFDLGLALGMLNTCILHLVRRQSVKQAFENVAATFILCILHYSCMHMYSRKSET